MLLLFYDGYIMCPLLCLFFIEHLCTVTALYVQVNVNTWLWSMIFHTRDTDFTEVKLLRVSCITAYFDTVHCTLPCPCLRCIHAAAVVE